MLPSACVYGAMLLMYKYAFRDGDQLHAPVEDESLTCQVPSRQNSSPMMVALVSGNNVMIKQVYSKQAILSYIAAILLAIWLVIIWFSSISRDDLPVTVTLVDGLVKKLQENPMPDKVSLFKLMKLSEVKMKTVEAKQTMATTAAVLGALPLLRNHLNRFHKQLSKLQPKNSMKAWKADGMRLRGKAEKDLNRLVDAIACEKTMSDEDRIRCRDRLLACIAAYDDRERNVISSLHTDCSLDDFPADKIIEEAVLLGVFKSSMIDCYGESLFALVTQIIDPSTRRTLLQELATWYRDYGSEGIDFEESDRFKLWKNMFPRSMERMKAAMEWFGLSLRGTYKVDELKAAGIAAAELHIA
jgi:hypothetical protein